MILVFLFDNSILAHHNIRHWILFAQKPNIFDLCERNFQTCILLFFFMYIFRCFWRVCARVYCLMRCVLLIYLNVCCTHLSRKIQKKLKTKQITKKQQNIDDHQHNQIKNKTRTKRITCSVVQWWCVQGLWKWRIYSRTLTICKCRCWAPRKRGTRRALYWPQMQAVAEKLFSHK